MPELIPIGHPWIDENEAPLYVWTFPTSYSLEELHACLEARERWATVAEYPVAWVVDLSRLAPVTGHVRREFGAHLERFEPHDVTWNRGSAIVVPNALIRGVVTAVFWLKPPRFPNQAFDTYQQAHEWASEQLAADLPEKRI